MLIRVFFQCRFQWSKSVVESQVICKIRLYTNVWLFRDYPMFIGVFPSFTFSGRSRSGVFCKVCFKYTYVWQFRGYSMSIRGFSQFRFQWSRPFLRHADKHISDHLGTIQCWYGFFPSFVFDVQTVVSGVVSTSCWYARVWLFRGYSMLIRGFSQFRFQWSRPFLGSFARHADKHISDYLGTIQ